MKRPPEYEILSDIARNAPTRGVVTFTGPFVHHGIRAVLNYMERLERVELEARQYVLKHGGNPLQLGGLVELVSALEAIQKVGFDEDQD